MITLSERIKLELRLRNPIEITELILDNSKATCIEGISNDYKNLRQLSLVNVGLTTLKNFPLLPCLEKLDLSDNRISCGLDNLKSCPVVNQLFLTNNKLRSLNEVKVLGHLKSLEVLDLSNCGLSESENYRRKVFEMIPSLKYLDGYLEVEDYEDYESDSDCYEKDSYISYYDSEEQESDENYDDYVNKAKVSGKRGKFKSKVNYVTDDEDEVDSQLSIKDLYDDGRCENQSNSLDIDYCTLDSPNNNYNDHYEVIDQIEHDDSDNFPPSHGSKFVPVKFHRDVHKSLKRSHLSDDTEMFAKRYCQKSDFHSTEKSD